NVSLDVVEGEFVCFLGPSGCGKTTLLRAIAGLEQPTAGSIRIDGQAVYDAAERRNIPTEQRGVSMVFQSYAVWPHMTVFDNVAYGLRVRKQNAADIKANDEKNAAIEARLVAAPRGAIASDPELGPFAQNAGKAVFQTWCAQCHGAGAGGAKGFPNLLDNDWLWGGKIEDVLTTVTHGIRNTTDADARFSQMPAFGEILEKADIEAVVNHVLNISGQPHDAALASKGAQVFTDNCAVCHGPEGKGGREQGAPNLTDAIWLYGGDKETITETVTKARFGVMPAWTGRLSDSDIRAVATYVHSLGGGE
ncbi:MAG: cytochrome-c oxidase, cbb3-type subunit III, partial [Rhodobacteraceae bacterium]|nr:cytochrome-c oxidase, cbb3-type subunit III [Paracoccaceae bacterium]